MAKYSALLLCNTVLYSLIINVLHQHRNQIDACRVFRVYMRLVHGAAADSALITLAYAIAACDDLYRQPRRGAAPAGGAPTAPPVPPLPAPARPEPPAAQQRAAGPVPPASLGGPGMRAASGGVGGSPPRRGTPGGTQLPPPQEPVSLEEIAAIMRGAPVCDLTGRLLIISLQTGKSQDLHASHPSTVYLS